MSEDRVEKGSALFENQARPEFAPFAEGFQMSKFVHLSAQRLRAWADKEGVNLNLSPQQEEDGVVLVGYIEEEHLGILAEGLGMNYNKADKDKLGRFGVLNAGHIIGVDSVYRIGGASENLTDESDRNLANFKKNHENEAKEMNEKTLQALSRVYQGKYKFKLL